MKSIFPDDVIIAMAGNYEECKPILRPDGYGTKYVRQDLAQSLADALDAARNCIDMREPEDMDKMDIQTLAKIDAALANYRKGE